MSDTPQQPGLNSLSKSFEPAAIEARWGPLWEERGYARAGYRGTGEPKPGEPSFAIQLPPPNVTGTLHMGRKNFVAKVWEWREKSGKTITTQMRRMGDSVDWSHEYFTMDDDLSQTVTETFVQLYEQGLIYRGKRLVNWDPVLKSAVSDLEVVNEERNGFMWHILYPFS